MKLGKKGFIDPNLITVLAVVLIAAGIIFLVLHHVDRSLAQAGFNSTSAWYSSYQTIQNFAETAFTFVGIALFVGAAVVVIRIVRAALM